MWYDTEFHRGVLKKDLRLCGFPQEIFENRYQRLNLVTFQTFNH